jgi:UDP-glucose 4-epimerase
MGVDGFTGHAIIHLAARTGVPDSVVDPLGYYLSNTVKARALLAAFIAAGVKRFLPISSLVRDNGMRPRTRADL